MDSDVEQYYSSQSDEELDTDDELQIAFANQKLANLKGGLIKPLVSQKTYTNNLSGLQQKTALLQENGFDWLESMAVLSTIPTIELETDGAKNKENTDEEDQGLDVNDDFKREMHFVHQAQSAVKIGLDKLREHDIPISRPEDYFAEMVKSDDHMRKVKQQLINKQKRIEGAEKARKLRDLRKYGKKVQQEVLLRRQQEKKSMIKSVGKFAKRRGERPDFLGKDNEDEDTSARKHGRQFSAGSKSRLPLKSKKRQMKDRSYGFGGKKKGSKSNTASSSADMRSFNSAKHSKASSGKRKGQGAQKRLGKGRRQKMKQRK